MTGCDGGGECGGEDEGARKAEELQRALPSDRLSHNHPFAPAFECSNAYNGQLGNGAKGVDNSGVPVAVQGGLTFTQIAAGGTRTCGLEASGAVSAGTLPSHCSSCKTVLFQLRHTHCPSDLPLLAED